MTLELTFEKSYLLPPPPCLQEQVEILKSLLATSLTTHNDSRTDFCEVSPAAAAASSSAFFFAAV